MTLYGVDALYPPPSASIKAAGKSFVMRYSKNVTAAALAQDRAAGLDTCLFFESTGTDFTGLAGAGAADATLGQAQVNAVGCPTAVLFFAIDTDTVDFTGVIEYLHGAASVIGLPRVGVYGSDAVISAVMAAGAATYYCQTYAWSSGMLNPRAHIYQYQNGAQLAGYTVDLDQTVVSDTDFGQIKWADPPPQGDQVFIIKDPSSALCIVFDGAYGIGLPDEATLNVFKAAGVPWLAVSQEFFDSIPMAHPATPPAAATLSAAQAQQLADVAAAVARIEAALDKA